MRSLAVTLLVSTALASSPAFAAVDAEAEAAAAATSTEEGEAIVVFGKGETRQVQEVDARDIQILTPGTSVIRAIEKLPSVNIQAADPFGNYEWSTRVTIRGFNQNQLGFTFDGIPLGDMSYGNHIGLHISRIASTDKYKGEGKQDQHMFNAKLVITPEGKLYTIARLNAETELAGACFSPDGRTLFVNAYSPGRTLAITGPWRRFAAR